MLKSNSDTPRDHIIIPDMQVKEGFDINIATAVGNYIAHHRPEVIVNLGDFADMTSCSFYDYGKASFVGENYNKDVAIVRQMQDALFAPIHAEQERFKSEYKLKRWQPLKVMVLGNHEERINRVLDGDHRLKGLLSMEDLGYEEFYDHVSPFLEPVIIDGVMYVHYGFDKMPNKPVAGVNQARTLLTKYMCSITVGHTPEFHYAEMYRANEEKIQCVVAGACFNHHEAYAGQRNNRYWRGIIHKKEVSEGVYDFEKISLHRLLRDYS